MSEEVWKDIPGIFSRYSASDRGRVRNNEKNFILKPTRSKSTGYEVVNLLGDDGRRYVKGVHVLVAESFLPNPDNKRLVNHIDTDKTNNSLENLEWATDSENMLHAFRNGLCENTRAAAYNQVKKLQSMPKTDRQRESARENIIKLHGRPKTDRQIEASKQNLRSDTCQDRAMQSHYDRHPPIRLIETGEIFRSQKELAEKLGISESAICKGLKSGRKHVGGYHLEYVDQHEIREEREIYDMTRHKPFLYDFQMEAVRKAFNGCIFNGGVGSGKSRTSLFYYFKEQNGWIDGPNYTPMKNPKDLYIITTAMKRDKAEWDSELALFRLCPNPELNYYDNTVVIDSWNNIKKYVDVKGAFFIFDEDRLTGSGAWVKTFLKIAKNNDWIILSATPADTWIEYWSVFVANGFYKNKTEFIREHVVYSQYSKYPKIDRYVNTQRLMRLRDRILIDMSFARHTKPHHEDVYCDYDIPFYKDIIRRRWDPYRDEPIQQASSLCYILRRIVNSDESRQVKLLELLEDHPRAIIFYNFDYERDILLNLGYAEGTEVAEWSGHAHQPLPTGDRWVYLTQYTAGCEGWNTVTTDTTIFYSQNYSYKVMTQAAGRIDRLNTGYIDLYYYHLKTRSGIDLAISKALRTKKVFNETKWLGSRS